MLVLWHLQMVTLFRRCLICALPLNVKYKKTPSKVFDQNPYDSKIDRSKSAKNVDQLLKKQNLITRRIDKSR